MPNDSQAGFSSLIELYQTDNFEQIEVRKQFLEFARSHTDVFHRHHPPGHFTASCWLVSNDEQRVLLTHHKKLGRWLQLGGHADGNDNLIEVALCEAQEESGLSDLVIEAKIFDLDAHLIPARKEDPEHIHWDVRFVIRAMGSEQYQLSEESLALAWRNIVEISKDPDSDASLRRMAEKWLKR
jgi:8-oxo-dGTP pyrophosphatase MutT (NUDIX family)